MKRKLVLLLVGTIFILPSAVRANEFSIRLGPQAGILGVISDTTLHRAVTRYNFISDLNVEYQITGRWFATASFHYFYFIGKLDEHGYLEVFAPTAGIRIVSFEEVVATGDFFDKTRWWFALEGGPYIHHSHFNTVIPRGQQTDLGFSIGGGFDTLFHKRWAAGFKMKMHYVPYGPDDYILFQFGPHLMFRFY